MEVLKNYRGHRVLSSSELPKLDRREIDLSALPRSHSCWGDFELVKFEFITILFKVCLLFN